MFLFVVYFSFVPVISANIHRYVNYFDIQVLMMVIETETLKSTLHHNIFTYLDFFFSATFILSDFNPFLLSYRNIQVCLEYISNKLNSIIAVFCWVFLGGGGYKDSFDIRHSTEVDMPFKQRNQTKL